MFTWQKTFLIRVLFAVLMAALAAMPGLAGGLAVRADRVHQPLDGAVPAGLSPTADWDYVGQSSDDELGSSVANAGDVNGDGYADVIVGAPGVESGTGKAYLFEGGPTGLSAAAMWTARGDSIGDGFGGAVAGAGDVNGDGYADVIVGAESSGLDRGKVYLFLGGEGGLDTSPDWFPAGEANGDHYGSSVAGVGDVNGDGYADVMVGAHNAGNAQGRAYLYYGSASGLGGEAWAVDGQNDGDLYGRSVAGAGDVNGDGYADILVGASLYKEEGTDRAAGRAYLYLGGPQRPSYQYSWEFVPEDGGDAFCGFSVAGAGDVNGDGYTEVIVGAWGWNNGSSKNWGRAYVFRGSASGLSATPSWTYYAEAEGDQLGYSVAGAGDVDADGYADLLVGIPGHTAGRGRFRLYFGSAEFAAGQPLTRSGDLGDKLGFSVAGAGDVNGDGYADVIAGAVGHAGYKGKAEVYHGSADVPSTVDDWHQSGEGADDDFGTSVASAGDVNGDGYTDVLVGAPGWPDGQNHGKAYVYHGSEDGPSLFAAESFPGEGDDYLVGKSVAAAGDVNGDGYGDVIVGVPGYDPFRGKAYVFYGSSTGLSLAGAWSYVGDTADEQFGYSVAGAGDVNGDGYADIVVGAPEYSTGSFTSVGRVYLFYGSDSGPDDSDPWILSGAGNNHRLGTSVAGAGDVNGDGLADVIVGGPGFLGDSGQAAVYLGSASGLSSSPAWQGWGYPDDDKFGSAVAGAGDVNGDGYGDFLVGAPEYDDGSGRGRVYLYYGSAPPLDEGADWDYIGLTDGDHLGGSVASAGDANGDGYADIVVGARDYSIGAPGRPGRAFLFYGGATGPSSSPEWWATGEAAGDRLGSSVASAGDVDGDGYADIIVGAYSYGGSQGRGYVFLGNDGGGRWVLARQQRGDMFLSQVPPWGLSHSGDSFRVLMQATDPAGRTKAKLEIEACPPGVAFGDDACTTTVSAEWHDTMPTADGPSIQERVSGLDQETLYRWRARLLYAPYMVTRRGITPPPNPAHGPWRRFQGQADEADVRTTSCSYGLKVAPTSDAASGRPGESVVYTLRLDNTGTCVDTANVAASGGAWTTNVPSSVGPLPVGGGLDVEVTVEIPAGAKEGDSDSVTITFTSQGASSRSARSELTTTVVQDWLVYLPTVMRNH